MTTVAGRRIRAVGFAGGSDPARAHLALIAGLAPVLGVGMIGFSDSCGRPRSSGRTPVCPTPFLIHCAPNWPASSRQSRLLRTGDGRSRNG